MSAKKGNAIDEAKLEGALLAAEWLQDHGSSDACWLRVAILSGEVVGGHLKRVALAGYLCAVSMLLMKDRPGLTPEGLAAALAYKLPATKATKTKKGTRS